MALFKAVVWALIFLTKPRFPPGVSIASVLPVSIFSLRHGNCLFRIRPLENRGGEIGCAYKRNFMCACAYFKIASDSLIFAG